MSQVPILTGPTATGKSAFALDYACARRKSHGLKIEIVNADSLLVYRDFDIGTAKPTPNERGEIPHHLIDIHDPDARFTAGDFKRAAEAVFTDIHARGARALVVGGTGFYLKALILGLWEVPPADPKLRAAVEKVPSEDLYQELLARDEQSALKITRNDRYRLTRAIEILRQTGQTPRELEQAKKPVAPDPRFELLIVDRESPDLEARIKARTQAMLDQGLIEETELLQKKWPGAGALKSVGYAQVVDHLSQKRPPGRKPAPGRAGLASEIELATRQLVKKQRTWFKGQKMGRWFTLDAQKAALEDALDQVFGVAG